ncbi:MAG: hypothetical protein KGQ58_04710 [Proteobacteria bacterium]|nr:hypothetical protein [Pseudomonadota bacterium]
MMHGHMTEMEYQASVKQLAREIAQRRSHQKVTPDDLRLAETELDEQISTSEGAAFKTENLFHG